MSGYQCGKQIQVQCSANKPYCTNNSLRIPLTIVDYCSPDVCPGKYDMVLEEETFKQLCSTDQPKMEVDVFT